MDEIGRVIFWNVGGGARWITYAFLVVTMVAFVYGLKKRYAMWKIGKPSQINFMQRLGERIGYFISNAIFQGTGSGLRKSSFGEVSLKMNVS